MIDTRTIETIAVIGTEFVKAAETATETESDETAARIELAEKSTGIRNS